MPHRVQITQLSLRTFGYFVLSGTLTVFALLACTSETVAPMSAPTTATPLESIEISETQAVDTPTMIATATETVALSTETPTVAPEPTTETSLGSVENRATQAVDTPTAVVATAMPTVAPEPTASQPPDDCDADFIGLYARIREVTENTEEVYDGIGFMMDYLAYHAGRPSASGVNAEEWRRAANEALGLPMRMFTQMSDLWVEYGEIGFNDQDALVANITSRADVYEGIGVELGKCDPTVGSILAFEAGLMRDFAQVVANTTPPGN